MNGEESGSIESPDAQSAEKRSRKYRIVAYVVAVLAALIIGTVIFVLLNGDNGDDEALVPTTTSSTLAPSTTTMTIDPRQKYVGLEHDDRGAGLQLGAEIRSIGYRVEGFETPVRIGDHAYFWVRDELGDMLWLDTVTKAGSEGVPLRAKVQAVWEFPAIADDQSMCLGWCYSAQNKRDISVVAIFDSNGKPLKAWRVDVTKPSFDSISATGWKQYLEVVEPEIPIPSRPELYGAVVQGTDEERAIYNAQEQVIAGGGGTVGASSFVLEVLDHKENKRALVSVQDRKVIDIVVTDMVNGASLVWGAADNPPFTYDGKADPNVIVHGTFDGATLETAHVAFRIDDTTHKFTKLDPSKVASKQS